MFTPIDTPEGRQLQGMYDLAERIRGSFLDRAIPMDLLIMDILSQHFCPDLNRRTLLFSLILSDLSFYSRIEKLQILLKTQYEDLLQRLPTLNRELTAIREFRNDLAHAMLDTSDEILQRGETDRIYLVSYKKGKMRRRVVMEAEIQDWHKRCNEVQTMLINVQSEVIRRASVRTR